MSSPLGPNPEVYLKAAAPWARSHAAPSHRQRGPGCLSLAAIAARDWSEAERAHLSTCSHCRRLAADGDPACARRRFAATSMVASAAVVALVLGWAQLRSPNPQRFEWSRVDVLAPPTGKALEAHSAPALEAADPEPAWRLMALAAPPLVRPVERWQPPRADRSPMRREALTAPPPPPIGPEFGPRWSDELRHVVNQPLLRSL